MPLAPQLESADYKVATLAMPWSSLREYDAGYPQALAEIGAAAQSLRDKGAKRIVVARPHAGARTGPQGAGAQRGQGPHDAGRGHEKSKYLVVTADHLSVVDVIGPELVGRLQAL